jgi:hypothetical protein
MITKTVRSRFNHEVGEKVEGCTILERRIIIPPDPSQRRLGVYDYVVEAPPVAVVVKRESHGRAKATAASTRLSAPEQGSFTRSTPEDMASRVIRRVPSR